MIIGIAGEAGSGKGTAADVLIERGFVKGKFAAALKEMLRALLRYRGVDETNIERMIEGDLKELPQGALNGKSPRYVMQSIGQWGRDEIDTDFWIDVELDAKRGEKNLVFDDLRHDNEEAALVKLGAGVLQIVGRGGIGSDHISENFTPKHPTVIDNSGTIEELRAKVDRYRINLSWAQAA